MMKCSKCDAAAVAYVNDKPSQTAAYCQADLPADKVEPASIGLYPVPAGVIAPVEPPLPDVVVEAAVTAESLAAAVEEDVVEEPVVEEKPVTRKRK